MILTQLFTNPIAVFVWLSAILYAITVHEFSHALAAKILGDDTPEHQGRLSLNPLAHIDQMGLLLLVLVGFGWGKPVQFDASHLRNRRFGSALVGLAGPAANLVSIVVFGLLIRVLMGTIGYSYDNLMIQFFVYLMLLNSTLMVFNLIPIPPLDGHHVLFAVLPDRLWRLRAWLETRGPFLLLGLIIIDMLSGGIVFGTLFRVFQKLVLQILL